MSDSLSAFGRACPDTLPANDGRKTQPPLVGFKDIAVNFAAFAQAVDVAARYEHVGKKPRADHIAWTVLRFSRDPWPSYTTLGRAVHKQHTSVMYAVRYVTQRAVHDDPKLMQRIIKIARSLERDGWNVANVRAGMEAAAAEWAKPKKKAIQGASKRRKIAAVRAYRNGENLTAICERMKMHRTTLIRALRAHGLEPKQRGQSFLVWKESQRASRAA